MDINLLREASTVISFGVFAGIVWFAVNPKNKARFDEAARLPFDEDGTPTPTPTPTLPQGGGSHHV